MRSLAVVALLACLGGTGVAPQDPPPDPAMLHRAKQLSVVTDHHRRLEKLAGQWEVVLRSTPPGSAAHEDRGRLVATPILGGRYIVLNFQLELRGAKVEAVQMLGFDTLRQIYTASWRDSASTWSVESSGPPSATEPDQLTLQGNLVDANDSTGRAFRQVFDLRNEKTVKVTMFDTVQGKEVQVQTMEWTKV